MIFGAHILFYSTNPEADRAFLRDALGLRFVDSGGGWLIFALPPAEAGVHPSDGAFTQEHAGRRMLGSILYLMCDDLAAEIRSLAAKGVTCTPVEHDDYGDSTAIPLPSGAFLGLYQPTHPIALHLTTPTRSRGIACSAATWLKWRKSCASPTPSARRVASVLRRRALLSR